MKLRIRPVKRLFLSGVDFFRHRCHPYGALGGPTYGVQRRYFFSRLTVISGTSAPGVTIDTDWWLPRVVKVMFDVSPGACATAWTRRPSPVNRPEMPPVTLRVDSWNE